MQQLLDGYAMFRSRVLGDYSRHFAELASCEEPRALFITCSDSRVMPEMIMQCAPGELLCCRNTGNLVPPPEETASGVAATVEYALHALHVPDIIVCGHSDCGAMRALLDEGQLKDLPLLRAWLCHAGPMAHAFRGVMQDPRVWPADERLRVLTEMNVMAQLRSLSLEHIDVVEHEFRRRLRQHVHVVRRAHFVELIEPSRRAGQVAEPNAGQAKLGHGAHDDDIVVIEHAADPALLRERLVRLVDDDETALRRRDNALDVGIGI